VRTFLGRLDSEQYADPAAGELAVFLQAKRAEVLDLVGRAEFLAQALQARSPEFTICHADIHAGNLLIHASGEIYIVDWDNPIFAPKERDLMYAGGGQFGSWRTPQAEERLFYQGYGPAQIDREALAYCRYERIVADIAVYCEQLFWSDEGGEDREQSLIYLKSNFLPGGVIEIAYQAERVNK
jgi:spectinomycin phosphotransferase